ncbi:19234_t:CDS:1, partial [Cetraspora pellucida]
DTLKEQLQSIKLESIHKTRQELILGIDMEEGRQHEGKIQQTNL